ncbi:MAG TPA: hypothetical protein V6D20_07480, partial [Candidatus Obscuribacterales bacterium]
MTLNDQLGVASQLNTTFSQRAWEDAKQDGCLPKPHLALPQWPPPAGRGFVFPTAQKKPQELLDLGAAEFNDQEVPFMTPRLQQPLPPTACGLPSAATETYQPHQPHQPQQPTELSERVAQKIAADMLGLDMEGANGVAGAYADMDGPGLFQPETCHSWNQQPILPVDTSDSAPPPVPSPTPTPTPTPSPSPYYDPHCILDNPGFKLTEVPPCTWKAMEGIVDDFQHWDKLPKKGTGAKLGYVLGRNDRPFYLIMSVIGLLVLILTFKLLFSRGSRAPSS